MSQPNRILGRLTVAVREPGGALVAVRRRANTVLLSGATLVGELFAGRVATPVDGMGVGTNPEPAGPPYDAAQLDVNDDGGTPLTGPVVVALAEEDFTIEPTDDFRVRALIRGVIPAEGARAADGGEVAIAEAALGVLDAQGTALDRIYNRVTFEPVPKQAEHELALYWEVFFPYGP